MKNIIADSFNENNNDIIMEMADQLRNEGFHEGFAQGIRDGLKTAIILKFGDNSNNLIERLNQINDMEKLARINELMIVMKDKNELQKMML